MRAWNFSSSQHVESALKNSEQCLSKEGKKLDRENTPTKSSHRLELDASHELNPEEISHCQTLIGTLTCIVELGRIDVCVEASMMASCVALHRKGHVRKYASMFLVFRFTVMMGQHVD